MQMLTKADLDGTSEVPLYRQLHRRIGDLIESGRLAKGEKLPATRELAGLLGVNRTTVSAAYELLESEGLIAGHVGRGSFVTGGRLPRARNLDWDGLLDRPRHLAAPALAVGKEGISFANSRPSEQLFPLDAFRATCDEVMSSPDFASILQLGSPSGYEPLRQFLLEEGHAAGTVGAGDDIIVTSGCQQALDLMARVLLRPGDRVALEDPVYPGVRNVFSEAGAELAPIPMGGQGLDMSWLERVLERERPKLLVLGPNFQNPTGATLPRESRPAVLRLARQAGAVVVENDIYGDLRYKGEALPSLKRLDESGETVLLRSFSKVAFPGLRVGWVTGPKALVARLVEAKQLADLHTDQLSQAVLLRFAQTGRLEEHRRRVLEAGAERLETALAACERHLPPGSRWTRPEGGMNLWVRLPEPLDSDELLASALRAKVAYLPGRYFAVSRVDPGTLRLSFAGLAPDEIWKGLSILGEIFSTELEQARGSQGFEPAPAVV